MLILYWQIGRVIVNQRKTKKWGSKVITLIAQDLSKEFKTMKGFSSTNLKYMALFAETYPNLLIVHSEQGIGQAVLDQYKEHYFVNDQFAAILNITWYHNLSLLHKLKDMEQRIWYAKKTIENGWSRNVLVHQITTNLFARQAHIESKTNNYTATLSFEQSEALQELVKDEYNLEFIDNCDGLIKERVLERSIVDNIEQFLLELGKGFAFVGKQYHLEVSNQDSYIDLLFYHITLKSYIVIELKTGKFKPEYVGKMGFYLACVDDYLKDENDNHSIGIILCQDEDKEIRNKSVQCMIKPMGVSTYKLADDTTLPKELEPLQELEKIL